MCEYDSHEEMAERLRALEVSHPGLAKTGIIGKTVEGRDLIYIKVGVGGSGGVRPGERGQRGEVTPLLALFPPLPSRPNDRERLPAEKNRVPLTETH